TSSARNHVLSSSCEVLSRAPIHAPIAATSPAAMRTPPTMNQTIVPARAAPLTVTTLGPPIETAPPASAATNAPSTTMMPITTARTAPRKSFVTSALDMSNTPFPIWRLGGRASPEPEGKSTDSPHRREHERRTDRSWPKVDRTVTGDGAHDVRHHPGDTAKRDDRPHHGEGDRVPGALPARPEEPQVSRRGDGRKRRHHQAVDLGPHRVSLHEADELHGGPDEEGGRRDQRRPLAGVGRHF